MKKFKKFLSTFSFSDDKPEEENKSDNISHETVTHLSIGENKHSKLLTVTFHPDAFFADSIELYDEPPLQSSSKKLRSFELELKQHSPQIIFSVTISPRLCEMGYVRVDGQEFIHEIKRFMPICLSIINLNTSRDYLYIPMTATLPPMQQRHGLFDDILVPTLMVLPDNPKLYRYKLTESFLWRFQYVRIREYTSLKMEVIGEIPCDLSFEIIGYPVRAILPNFMDCDNDNIIDKDINQRRSMVDIEDWSVFENSYWVKLAPSCLRKLPLMSRCVDDLREYIKYETEADNEDTNNNNNNNTDDNDNRDWVNEYFQDKGYVIQQYMGHTVLEKIGPLIGDEHKSFGIPISIDSRNNIFVDAKKDNYFQHFPTELIAHIFSYCDFDFIRHILCCVSKMFHLASSLPSCYGSAVIPSIFLDKMIQKKTFNKMLISLKKCKKLDIYSLVCEENIHSNESMARLEGLYDKNRFDRIKPTRMRDIYGECHVEEFHLEFVTKPSLHYPLFNVFDFNQSLRVLKLTQCNNISNNALPKLPNNLEELYLMNTLVNVESWGNLKSLKCLVITKSANLHSNNQKFLKVIVDTLPKQILQSICIWDGEEDNKGILKQLIENHNEVLRVFGIGGRICLYQPFSTIFTGDDCKYYPNLEIITVSCLTTNEITQLINVFGHQLRIFEMYCPFVMDAVGQQDEDSIDIYKWLLNESQIDSFCEICNNLEILMVQAFPHERKKYMKDNRWKELRQTFEQKFWHYRTKKKNNDECVNDKCIVDKSLLPLIIFDFGMDLVKMSEWTKPNIRKYLINNQHRLELNFGQGV